MCTSFAVYKTKPIYAMNFDCWDIKSRLRISQDNDKAVFYYEVDLGGGFLETASMNTDGFFGNFQGNLSDKHRNISPDESCMTVDKLYRQSLSSAKTIEDFNKILNNKRVVYPPVPPEFNMLHNMFADKYGSAVILETAEGNNDITPIDGDFIIMTNFPAGQFKGMNYNEVCGAGSERYKTAYESLQQHTDFDVKEAFELLKATMQKEEHWETLISMVFVPEESAVYLALKRNFDKVWKIDIKKNRAEAICGFNNPVSIELDDALDAAYLENM